MSETPVVAEDVGRACPYCRFPLKAGVQAHRCDVCGALHHADCWRDGGGCVIVGCAGGGTEATVVQPAASPATAPDAATAPRPRTLVGIAIGLAIMAAGIGGYYVAHSGGHVATVTAAPPPPVSAAPAAQSDPQRAVMRQLAAAVALSQRGRTAVRERRYLVAIDNRRLVLRRLDAIDGAQGSVAVASRMLRAAMEASLASDRAYASGADPTASDALATARKRAFVQQWNPLAAGYGLDTYREGDI